MNTQSSSQAGTDTHLSVSVQRGQGVFFWPLYRGDAIMNISIITAAVTI